jgi:hypothetical protein
MRRSILSVWPEVAAKADLKEFFSGRVAAGRIPVELTPKDWSRFTDNVFGLVASRGDRPKPGVVADVIRRDFEAEPQGVPLSIERKTRLEDKPFARYSVLYCRICRRHILWRAV